MKTTILKISMILLFLSLMGAGCEKEDPNYDPDSIIGKWKWLYSINGDLTNSYSYPEDGQILTLEFRQNSDLIFRDDGNIYSETVFSISQDTLIYNGNIYEFEISEDTLKLINTFTLGDYSIYKRVN